MELTILAFGNIADLFGAQEIKVQDVLSKDALISMLNSKYPKLKDMTYAIAINRVISSHNEVLDEHSEVALIPPFSGG